MKVLILSAFLSALCLAADGEISLPQDSAVPALSGSMTQATEPPPSLLPSLLDLPRFPLELPSLPIFPWPPTVREMVDTSALIRAAAHKHGVPAVFIKSIVAAESNFDAAVISPKGAIGLMQLMPSTAQLFGADPAIPAQNVDAGTHYLRVLLSKYHKYRDGLRRVIAAYNAGPAAVDHYHGVPPYPETRIYVARVLYFLKVFRREPV
jgi:soluble lytic murein transglycosylase-like protein